MACSTCCGSKKECCKSKTSKIEDPGDLIVAAIEEWCDALPINEEDDEATKAAKEKIATDIFQKVGLLNSDPQAANNQMLYRDMLADEVEAELQQITEGHPEIGQIKDKLKDSLLDKVMDAKLVIKDISAGENYKQALENSIDSSLPNPVHISPENDPGFELYKHRMAMLWLLENYDYAVDFNSLKYKKKLNEDIELYADETQKRNVLPLEKYEMFNEAFSAMYKQNPPHESSIIEEVENVKMRCEIDAWFKELPLQKASGYQELLEREQILSLLSKKLFEIERNKSNDSDERMRKEIIKWLHKLPLLPEENKNINRYVDKLLCNLKATVDVRKCKRKSVLNKDISIKEFIDDAKDNQSKMEKEATQIHAINKENTSQIAGPSGVGSKPCSGASSVPRKKAGDLITAAIEAWCNQLPLIAHSPGDQAIINEIREETILKMYQLLSDLHTDPNILNSEGLYDHHLNIEIERLLSELPAYNEAQQMRNARRARIIKELKAVRPIIKDEFDREGYKQNLKHVMSSFFEETSKPNKISLNENTKQTIIDNFIQLNYHKGEFEEQQLCKSKIDDAVAEVIEDNKNNTQVDPLLTRNQLICEMTKVKPPNESALTDEVQEIRMKEEVALLFEDMKIPNGDEELATYKEQTKNLLAKKLTDIERNGHNVSNDDKMKAEIAKALKKLGVNFNPGKIDIFVDHLKNTEDRRKALPSINDAKCKCGPNKETSSQKDPNFPQGPSLVMRSPSNSPQYPHTGIHGRSFHPQPSRVPQASKVHPPVAVQSKTFYPHSPNFGFQFVRPVSPPPRQGPRPSCHIPRPTSPSVIPPPSCRPVQAFQPPFAPALHAPMTSHSRHIPTPIPTCGPVPYIESPIASRSYSQRIPTPDFGLTGHQAAYRQPELASPITDERNVNLNQNEHGTRSTARLPESPEVRGDPSCSCQQIWLDDANFERNVLGDCNCRRNKKNKNCQGVCKADEVQYCNECENDYDCDFDVPGMPYPLMYPYMLPHFMYF